MADNEFVTHEGYTIQTLDGGFSPGKMRVRLVLKEKKHYLDMILTRAERAQFAIMLMKDIHKNWCVVDDCPPEICNGPHREVLTKLGTEIIREDQEPIGELLTSDLQKAAYDSIDQQKKQYPN